MKRIAMLGLLVVLIVVAPQVAFPQSSDMKDMKSKDMKSMEKQGMGMNDKMATTTHKGVGVVKEVNAADGIVTVAHEPIKSLNWPAMTMGFKLKDKAMVNKIKPGDKVHFTVVQAGKDYVITSIK